ncbi:glycosyltransferase family 4 protein [Novosphingobium tardum]|uniref:Glycosyltransferase family 4 protein n=1 Tax=Novosphingobium tardum TaxID=1538021 RepID=A0ABV8RLL4_9SPHN
MSENPVWFALASLYAVVLTVALAQFAPLLAGRLGLMDHPAAIKLHVRSTPLMGGVTVIGVLLPLLPIFMFVFEPEGLGNRALSVIVIATLLVTLIGVIDDRRDLPAALRFGLALAIFALAMAIEPRIVIDRLRITGLGSSLAVPGPVAFVFTLMIHVGFINSVNMADGKNGLVIGLVVIWLLFLLSVGPIGLIIVVLPLLQALGVLLVYNLRGKLFLGDGGTYGLSAFLGMVSIYAYNLADGHVTADTLALLYLVPGIDMLRLFFVRLMRGRSPFAGDRNHLHHLLEDGFGWPAGLIIYLALVSIPNLIALVAPLLVPTLFVGGALTYAVLYLGLSLDRRRRLARGSWRAPASPIDAAVGATGPVPVADTGSSVRNRDG